MEVANDYLAKISVGLITEVFKASVKGLGSADAWLREKSKGYDPFGIAAKKYVERLCGRYNSMRIFGMNEPVPLNEIFVKVNILRKITGRNRLSIEEMEKFFDKDRRSFGEKVLEKVDGLEIVNSFKKIIVLGKPGSGKTTFLKFLTMQALTHAFQKPLIPVFISLRDWADSKISLFNFIIQQFDICGFPHSEEFVKRMLEKGKCLVLLDGLDEVPLNIIDPSQHIKDFTDEYSDNAFIISCRIAAYNFVFEHFTDVEISDFDNDSIHNFISNWFNRDPKKKDLFLDKLYCQGNEPVLELASNPLLLTMLSIAFDEVLDFPVNRAGLYKEATDALLKKWDSSRSINRDNNYRSLPLKHKEDLLGFVAIQTFVKDQYFIPQRSLEHYIFEYISNIVDLSEDEGKFEETIFKYDTEAILKSIEAQHGLFIERAKSIYSFSHLTFQEYFAAKFLVDNRDPDILNRFIKKHLSNDKWREVFILISSLLQEADKFLFDIRSQIGQTSSSTISKFFNKLDKLIVDNAEFSNYASKAIAAFYLLDFVNERVIQYDTYSTDILSDSINRVESLALSLSQTDDIDFAIFSVIDTNLDIALDISEEFRLLIPKNSEFEKEGIKELEISSIIIQYLQETNLLVDCLNSGCYITQESRKLIFESLIEEPWTSPEIDFSPLIPF